MNIKSLVPGLLFFSLFIQLSDIQSQTIEKKYTIQWNTSIFIGEEEENSVELLHFENAIYGNEYPLLPLYFERIPSTEFYEDYDIEIKDMQTTPVSTHESSLIPVDFNSTELLVKANTAVESKKYYTTISFIPLIKRGPSSFVKVTSVNIVITGKKSMQPKLGKSYTNSSILSTGTWVKIAVSKTGMHKVTYQDLKGMGLSLSGLFSSQIALFGNGGGMLPEANSVSRIDDLKENPIEIFDGGDGVFDEGDYFVFYAQGPHTYTYNESTKLFSHKTNIYDDKAYYFITTTSGVGEKLRIQNTVVDNSNLTATHTATTYTHYDFLEEDKFNYGESGQTWLGDLFDVVQNRTYSFTVPEVISTSATLRMQAAFASNRTSSFQISINGNEISNFTHTSSGSTFATLRNANFTFVPTSSTLNIVLKYSKSQLSAFAYLDWLAIQATCFLKMHSAQFPFCNIETIGTNNITRFVISNGNASTKVWDVTEPARPVLQKGVVENGSFSFKAHTDDLRKYIAFNGSSYHSVEPLGMVANQNLHGELVDMIIVAHPDFRTQADRLAQFRRENDGLTVKVVTPKEVYNEFSSGAQDPTAIRDYMKVLYEKSNESNVQPKYLLLFGRPSYDYRGRNSATKMFVPNYQLNTAMNESSFRANDDYFGLLDDNEGNNSVGLIDVAIGRFPVTTVTQAKLAVDKTINYSSKTDLLAGKNSDKVSNLGDWRNIFTFVADDEDSNNHIEDADNVANKAGENKAINVEKIYADAYQQVSHSGGQRYPEVNKAITSRINRGTLIVNYMGHGGADGWAHERILTLSEINALNNTYNQTIMTTLTCEFSWYDRAATSPGELVFLNANGGATGLITTSRVAFTSNNRAYAQNLFSRFFEKKANGQYKTLGEYNKVAKNDAGGAIDGLNMIVVFGDPALSLAMPVYNVVTDSINGVSLEAHHNSPTTVSLDTLKSLSKVTVKGRITDENGNFLSDFNGNIYPSVYDKAVTVGTLVNDPASSYFEFELQKNIIFKGNASVKNGHFEFSFVVPKDINYTYGNGKISYYAKTTSADANGYCDDIIIGGIDANTNCDTKGPEIEVYLNDESFVNGGIVNPEPVLLINLRDELGINTTGAGIGHDIVAILDNADNSSIILNDYYQGVEDSSNCGLVRYNMSNLSVGKHTLTVRAWDICNNVTEKIINFEVISDSKLTLDHVLNYPNPFTTYTEFYFEQNQPGETYDILVQIFTISGKIVNTLTSNQYMQGNRSQPIVWDGRDQYGDKLGKGVYLYRMKVRNSQGETAEKIEKLVIL